MVTRPASCTHPASGRSTPASAASPHFNLQRPRGLLEPCAATSGTHGSEGGLGNAPGLPSGALGPSSFSDRNLGWSFLADEAGESGDGESGEGPAEAGGGAGRPRTSAAWPGT